MTEPVPSSAAALAATIEALLEREQTLPALDLCRDWVQLDSDNPVAWRTLGCLQLHHERHLGAETSLLQAHLLAPTDSLPLVKLGQLKLSLNQLTQASLYFEQALTLQPELVSAANGLAQCQLSQSTPYAAIATLTQALRHHPKHLTLTANLAKVYLKTGALEMALEHAKQVVHFTPQYAPSWVDIADISYQLGDLTAAQTAIEQALQHAPHDTDAHLIASLILQAQGQYERAIGHLKATINWAQPSLLRLGQLAECHARLGAWVALEALTEQLLDLMAKHPDAEPLTPLQGMQLYADNALQQQIATRWHQRYPLQPRLAPTQPYAHAKIRLGYLSADWSDHPIALWFQDFFLHHDRNQFEVIGFPSRTYASVEYERLCGHFDKIYPLDKLDFKAQAELIRRLEVDILIDLTGPTEHHHLDMLAYQPAPVQAQLGGLVGTLGGGAYRYIFATEHLLPPSNLTHVSETVVYLPDIYFPAPKLMPACCKQSRADFGLPEDKFVFCCHSQSYRITPEIFELWCQILLACPNSVLWLSGSSPTLINNLQLAAKQQGIASERIHITPTRRLSKHWHQRLADLWLDTHRMNGGTPTLLNTIAEVPMLTWQGQTPQSRVCGQWLTALGLTECVADTAADYVAKAVTYATQPAALAKLQSKLKTARLKGVVFDTARYLRGFEQALHQMLTHYWQQSPNQAIEIRS